MSIFFEQLFNLEGCTGEQQVCCPFPHTTADGRTYEDHHPSLAINLDKGVYHCNACGAKGKEEDMVAHIFHTTYQKAQHFIARLNMGVKVDAWDSVAKYDYDERALAYLSSVAVSPDVCRALHVSIDSTPNGYVDIDIPVFWHNYLIDIRHYRPGRQPKMYGEPGAPTGTIIPYDEWNGSSPVIICAGEKDMLCARSHDFNAITFTGGEMLNAPLDVSMFRGVNACICYDNDAAGRLGAQKLAAQLYTAGANIKVVDGFCKDFPGTDTKEDITDWFSLYGGTRDKLKAIIKNTPMWEPSEDDIEDDKIQETTLNKILDSECCDRTYKATVQLLTCCDETFEIIADGELRKEFASRGSMKMGESAFYSINEMPQLIPLLAGSNIRSQQDIYKRIRGDRGCAFYPKHKTTVYVATVADVKADFNTMTELTCYIVGYRPRQGKVYNVTFLRTTDEDKGTACMIVRNKEDIEEVQDISSTFEITDEIKASLLSIKRAVADCSVEAKINHRAQAVKGLLGFDADTTMVKLIDLTYNSCKEFTFKGQGVVRGFMDTLIVGESRVGKSHTATALRKAYDCGEFVSLAGSAATLPGIVGGSAKDVSGHMSTRAGVIPRSNNGLIIFEELSKAPTDVLKSLTDVRSSGLARITRVTGTLEMPASLRMISLSNAKPTEGGITRPLETYSGGLDVVQELIGAAEDIARYDAIALVGDKKKDYNYIPPEAYSTTILQDCIKWAWSRKAEQIKFDAETWDAVNHEAEYLNETYPLHIKLFGSECDKKLCRLAIAAAIYCCNTDETFENVIVTADHIKWARKFYEELYTSPLFKIQEVVKAYRATTDVVEADTKQLQEWYVKYNEAIDYLYAHRNMDKMTFKDLASFADDSAYGGVAKGLISRHFITSDRAQFYATTKFIKTYPLLNKEVTVPRV